MAIRSLQQALSMRNKGVIGVHWLQVAVLVGGIGGANLAARDGLQALDQTVDIGAAGG